MDFYRVPFFCYTLNDEGKKEPNEMAAVLIAKTLCEIIRRLLSTVSRTTQGPSEK